MDAITMLCYVLAILIFIFYFFIKIATRGYIFSIFNISIFVYCFAVFIAPIFYTQPESWAALGVKDHTVYFPYLNKCLTMNCIGLIFTFATMLFVEFNRKKKVCGFIYKVSGQILDSVLEKTFFIFDIAWYLIVLIFNGGLPIFGGRSFYYDSIISPIYLALNEIIMIYTIYFGVKMIYEKKHFLKFAIALMTMIFTGSRASVFVSVLPPIFLLFFYGVGKLGSKEKSGFKKFIMLVVVFLVIGLVGLSIGSIRDGMGVDLGRVVSDVLYGNNFSDIRDGAFILKGFESKFNAFWYGRTYCAGILSFIPSRFSSFRLEWSYGRITTYGLFGWEDHFGLRGGAVMEAYLNFGWFGVVIFAVAQGVVYALLEKIFYHIFYLKKVKNGGKEFLAAELISTLNNFFVCTAGMYNIYVDIVFILFLIICSKIIREKRAIIPPPKDSVPYAQKGEIK